ncbi:galactokinase [Corynebacterium capitovis DSM 44611]|uniref:galactokinase family protein n=1 Tax=Corynebacterium capitovis TaxID=131081 RepID=UPI0003605AB1|nr:galactokinase family protein [Corynebacterium capitovis]WKD57297.1 galactokinase [Corynebacterium capitovis DSM 44611]
MALWTPDPIPPAQRAAKQHSEITGGEPAALASAPGTWVLIGENVDHFGGVTLVGLHSLRVAVAVSPRSDDVIRINASGPAGFNLSDESSLAARADDSVTGRLTRRTLGLIHTLTTRQLVARSATGVDITAASDITVGTGLGALYAWDAALALALVLGLGREDDEAPLRARLAEACSVNVDLHSTLPVVRARHTAALRGVGETISVVDYADGSLTQAPHPSRMGVRIFAVTARLGEPYDEQFELIAAHRAFIDAACTNFGVDSLRQLPHAADRVAEWVAARRQSGDTSAPAPEVARRWVRYCETETLRSLATAKALRTRRDHELFTLLNSPSEHHDLDTPDSLVADLLGRGAISARPAAAGISSAVIAFVPHLRAAEFAASAAADYDVFEVRTGEPSHLEN